MSFTTQPLEWRFWCPENEGRKPPLSQDELLDRLDDAQRLLRLSPQQYAILVEIVAPDEGLDAGDPPREPGVPTDALPGTAERIEVMAHRLKMGFSLWHELDADWLDDDAEHLEQTGEMLRNGAIHRTRCKVAKRDGASVLVPRDPEQAVEELRRQFKGGDLRELAGLLWEGIGYQARKKRSPGEGFEIVGGKIVPPKRRRRKKCKEPAGQLLLWNEPAEAVPVAGGEVAA